MQSLYTGSKAWTAKALHKFLDSHDAFRNIETTFHKRSSLDSVNDKHDNANHEHSTSKDDKNINNNKCVQVKTVMRTRKQQQWGQ